MCHLFFHILLGYYIMDVLKPGTDTKPSFQSKVRVAIIAGAIDYCDYFINYDYLIVSDAFIKNNYYIISAVEGNYLHLTGVKTALSATHFFKKCIAADAPLQESDFSISEAIDPLLPKNVQKSQKTRAKGNVRRKIQALPKIKGIFHNPDTLVEEDFVKNRVHCTIAAKKEISTMGFIKASSIDPCSVKPNTLLKEQSLSPNAKPIKLALRRKRGDKLFNEITIGDKKILDECACFLKDLISTDLL